MKHTTPDIENLKTPKAIDRAAKYSAAPDTLRRLIGDLSLGFQCIGPRADAFGNDADYKRGPMLHWRIHLARKGAPYVFDYFGSINDCAAWTDARTIVPSRKKIRDDMIYSVLSCIRCDYYVPETFADFCGEFGYDADSRKALALWERCVDHSAKLKRCLALTDDELAALPS